jgi:hypothetical protein
MGRSVNAFYVSAIVSLTVLIAVSFGILAAYTLINGILVAFGRQTRPQLQRQPVLLARNAQAGAD